MKNIQINHNELVKEKLIFLACEDLYLNDYDLIETGGHHVAERSIVFRFGVYLDKYMSKYKSLNKYHLDSDYNRNLNDLRRIPSRQNGCYPDLIIHKRGRSNHNLLLIECKGWWSQENDVNEDLVKIREFKEDNEFRYKFGLLVVFKKNEVRIEWI